MLSRFERLIDPYPDTPSEVPPKSILAFIWANTQGQRRFILGMTTLTAAIGAFEALLFNMLGSIVDWLSKVPPAELWTQSRNKLLLLGAILLASPLAVLLQTMLKHQALAGNFPMKMRWNFHRLMLSQSMGFYQDEFAGRVATKVMQTAIAVRDTCFIVADILVFVAIYFATMTAVVGSFDAWLITPFLGWLLLYSISISYFVPRLSRKAKEQADARSTMTGRITDAYTNIATVKLFSHTNREASYAQSAMRDFMKTVYGQFRLVSGFEVINHTLSMLLILSTSGLALWL